MSDHSHPVISVELDIDTEEYSLMVTSYGYTATAGERLFKAPPHPEIQFKHTTRDAAQTDAVKLQKYIDEKWPKREMSKSKARKEGA